MGSPRTAAQQILVGATVTRLFIHSLLFRFSSSPTGAVVFSSESRRLHSSCCPPLPVSSTPSTLSPHPPTLPFSSLSVPFPQRLPPSRRAIRAARHKFTNSSRERESAGDRRVGVCVCVCVCVCVSVCVCVCVCVWWERGGLRAKQERMTDSE